MFLSPLALKAEASSETHSAYLPCVGYPARDSIKIRFGLLYMYIGSILILPQKDLTTDHTRTDWNSNGRNQLPVAKD